ncbi:hypothetical protein SCUP234_05640 [Seiridium cupressi]
MLDIRDSPTTLSIVSLKTRYKKLSYMQLPHFLTTITPNRSLPHKQRLRSSFRLHQIRTRTAAASLEDKLQCTIQSMPFSDDGVSVTACAALSSNLDSALRHLRHKKRPIVLWVDALCINQSDVEERNHQVHQMRTIYGRAQETIAYIGDLTGSNVSKPAWNFLERRVPWDALFKAEMLQRRTHDHYGESLRQEDLIETVRRMWYARVDLHL